MSDMLIVKRGSVPQIICFPYIHFVTSSTLNNVNYIFLLYKTCFHLLWKTYFLILRTSLRGYICISHILARCIFYTTLFCLFHCKFSFVNNRFKFGGCLLLLRNVLFLKHWWSSSFLCRMDLSCIMSVYISGFWVLKVVTYLCLLWHLLYLKVLLFEMHLQSGSVGISV